MEKMDGWDEDGFAFIYYNEDTEFYKNFDYIKYKIIELNDKDQNELIVYKVKPKKYSDYFILTQLFVSSDDIAGVCLENKLMELI